MRPMRGVRGEDQTRSDLDQTSGDADQTHSDSDQTGSDRDQYAADRDQLAAHGDAIARHRDLAALTRDRAAEARDREADEHDAETDRLAGSGAERMSTGAQIILPAARDRQRAAADRGRAAANRAEAAQDREQAARDRLLASDDRAHAATEREAAAVDALTGACRRGPGLAELQREIDRARRGTGQLVAAFVDVNGLKATNDREGHGAGDALLKHAVGVLQAHLRSYELIIRLGGDEFLCVLSGATIENARRRFDEMTSKITAGPDGGSVTVGFAELAPGDSSADLIARADTDLLAARGERSLRRSPLRV